MYTFTTMPELIHRLYAEDPGFWRIVAECWGLELPETERKHLLPALRTQMLNPHLFAEIVESLPADARDALTTLKRHHGQMPWAVFTRQFGELRGMGTGKRDRLQPQREPASAVEVLWYRALIGRDYLDVDGKLLECATIPAEFLDWLPEPPPLVMSTPGKPLSLDGDTLVQPVDDHILDQTCSLLASLRLSQPNAIPDLTDWLPSLNETLSFMQALKLIDSRQLPDSETARPFLSTTRAEAMLTLSQGWRESSVFNELFLVPSLDVDSTVKNNPADARKAILDLLHSLPRSKWWSLDAFIRTVHQYAPDFLRPDGDYTQWMICSAQTGEPLQGFEQWLAVEGALVRYMLSQPLHWLGFIDLAFSPIHATPFAFRLSDWFEDLYARKTPQLPVTEEEPVKISSSGSLSASTRVPRYGRYMIARFCHWEASSLPDSYAYRLTPRSLHSARDQGLTIDHLLSLLKRYSAGKIPPSLVKALKHWDVNGAEASVVDVVVLRVSKPEILTQLRASTAARFLGETLNPVSVVIPRKAVDKVLAMLMRMGYLADVTD